MEIRRYLAIVQRWFWLIIMGALLAGATAYFVSDNSPRVYRATARLLIDQAPGSSSGNEYTQILVEQRLTTTYVELIKLDPVMFETIERLQLPYTPEELNSMISVSAPPETQLIVISAEANDPQQATDLANTISQVFITQNEERQTSRFQESMQSWQSRMDELRDEIAALEAQIADFGEPTTGVEEADLSRLETSLREAEISYTEAFNNLELLRVEEAKGLNNVILVEPARPSDNPVRPRPLLNGLLATFAGGLVALGIVLLIEYLDDSVKSPEQIEENVGLSTLGAIAIIKGSESGPERLIAHNKPRDPISEAYRVLRTNLSFAAVDNGLQAFLVTSASPSEGKSTTVANLAIVMAQTGKQIIVVDSDLRRPTLHDTFDVPNSRGLTTALLDSQRPVSFYLQDSGINNLKILTSGPIPPNPAELLNSQRMSQIIAELKNESDTVIFDTPPVLSVADASIIAPRVDGSVLIVQSGKTRQAALEQAVNTLSRTNGHLLGVVLNQVVMGRSAYYYYHKYEYGPPEGRRLSSRLPAWLSVLSRRS